MKPVVLALVVTTFCSATTPEAFTPAYRPLPDSGPHSSVSARRVSRLVNDIESLYKAAYRPAKGVKWQEVLAVRWHHQKLQIVYRIGDRKEIVHYHVHHAIPRSRYNNGHSFVYDSRTGKDIFGWLQRKDDAAVLRQDLEELTAIVAQ